MTSGPLLRHLHDRFDWRAARRTVILFAPCALLVALAWDQLSKGSGGVTLLPFALVGLAPALIGHVWARVALSVAVLVAGTGVAFGVSPLDARPFDTERDFFGPVLQRLREGALAFYDVAVPFDPAEHGLMLETVRAAVLLFGCAAALAISARRPLITATVVVGATVWPVTIVGTDAHIWGVTALATALLLLAFVGGRPAAVPRAVLAATAALAFAAIATTSSPAVAKQGFLDWRSWDPYDRPPDAVGVDYVWDANYDGIRFPEKPTTVLTIKGPTKAQYWRATTLDVFDGVRWLERLEPLGETRREDDYAELLGEPFLPKRARDRSRWLKTEVEVEALRDRRLAAPATLVAIDPGDVGDVQYALGNIATADREPSPDDAYTVWSYTPQPLPSQLAAAPTRELSRAARYLEVLPGVIAPRFTLSRRGESVEALRRQIERAGAAEYVPLLEAAVRVAGDAPTPYSAAVALEAWFRRTGGFVYDEQPPPPGRAPLVQFVVGHRRGYCQYFAGAMSLMLRYLGVPARIAAGFTSGVYDASQRTWTVRDRDAHTWVEVWFPGWGWIPFDPTPGRGTLSGGYTTASSSANLAAIAATFGAGAAGTPSLSLLRELRESQLSGTGAAGRDIPGDLPAPVPGPSAGPSLVRVLAMLTVGLLAMIVLAKVLVRRARYVTRDPRRIAAACRAELAAFLVDQGIDVGRTATVGELSATAARRFSVDAATFARAAGAARFGPAERSRAAAADARRELRSVLRRSRRSLTPRARIRGLISLRSLGVGR
jgi:transglutaminase-like putative cysteine protease